ncbi:MAG: hypothetical protein JXA43_02720 [Candidatus Diapherotrites archaeon]|nr:hypothetical protein [Candidatus Diapherotrites archaeon]
MVKEKKHSELAEEKKPVTDFESEEPYFEAFLLAATVEDLFDEGKGKIAEGLCYVDKRWETCFMENLTDNIDPIKNPDWFFDYLQLAFSYGPEFEEYMLSIYPTHRYMGSDEFGWTDENDFKPDKCESGLERNELVVSPLNAKNDAFDKRGIKTVNKDLLELLLIYIENFDIGFEEVDEVPDTTQKLKPIFTMPEQIWN